MGVSGQARLHRIGRISVEPAENGMEAVRGKREFFELAERFRGASDPKQVKQLGEQLGRMVFGSRLRESEIRGQAAKGQST